MLFFSPLSFIAILGILLYMIGHLNNTCMCCVFRLAGIPGTCRSNKQSSPAASLPQLSAESLDHKRQAIHAPVEHAQAVGPPWASAHRALTAFLLTVMLKVQYVVTVENSSHTGNAASSKNPRRSTDRLRKAPIYFLAASKTWNPFPKQVVPANHQTLPFLLHNSAQN